MSAASPLRFFSLLITERSAPVTLPSRPPVLPFHCIPFHWLFPYPWQTQSLPDTSPVALYMMADASFSSSVSIDESLQHPQRIRLHLGTKPKHRDK